MPFSRRSPFRFENSSDRGIIVGVDDESFAVPAGSSLESTSSKEIYLTFAGDAPMLAFPVRTMRGADEVFSLPSCRRS